MKSLKTESKIHANPGLAELYDTKPYYQLIVSIKKKSILGNLWEPLLCEKIIGLLSWLYKQQENSKKELILACVIYERTAWVSNYRYPIWSCPNGYL